MVPAMPVKTCLGTVSRWTLSVGYGLLALTPQLLLLE